MSRTIFQAFLQSNHVFDIDELRDYIIDHTNDFEIVSARKRINDNELRTIYYYNIPTSFDIETTSFFRLNGNAREKCACMYIWTFNFCGHSVIGRTWEDFIKLCNMLNVELNLKGDTRLVCYVHNLAFDFQFFRGWLEWTSVFSLSKYKPLYAVCTLNIEFRCSYLLSGYSLAKLSEQLTIFNIKKMVGDLDYTLLRHSETTITKKELVYVINDGKIVVAYIAERIIKDGNIAKIPLTKTGYVRQYCRESCFNGGTHKRAKYIHLMRGMQLTVEQYDMAKRAFQGGYTHCNPLYSHRTMKDVTSFDFTSSYPAVMVAEKFPMSSGEEIEIKTSNDFYQNIKKYCCVFECIFTDLEPRIYFDNYISSSRCYISKRDRRENESLEEYKENTKTVISNGRLVRGSIVRTTITEQDYLIIEQTYKWSSMKIVKFVRYRKAYLPTDLVKAILYLYRDKTTLKGVVGKEEEYLNAKENINAVYGMMVTDIIRDKILFDTNGWHDPIKLSLAEKCDAIGKYNKSSSRFNFYLQGVYVTAYARRNLWSGILEFGYDYIYSDTDSIKVINADRHMEYIESYNRRIKNQLIKACRYHDIDESYIEPETIEGIKKPLGAWDFDGHYSRFRSLGAKRYMIEYSNDSRNKKALHGKINITVSGVNKNAAMPYLLATYKDSVFDEFKEGLYIPPEYTGKNTHTYIDEPIEGDLVDYNGVKGHFLEKSIVHLCPADYHLSLSDEYLGYIFSLDRRV